MTEDKMAEHQVATPESARVRVGPIGYQLRAREFFLAAELLQQHHPKPTHAAAFLYCRSIELALKAYLLGRDQGIATTRSFGHDLVQLLNECHAFGLDLVVQLSNHEKEAIATWNTHYLEHRLAYFDLFFSILGPPHADQLTDLKAAADRTINGVELGCLKASNSVWKPE